jgi:hypothetical protein
MFAVARVFGRDPLRLRVVALYLRCVEIGEAAHASHADAIGRDALRAQIFKRFIQLTGAMERSDYFTHHLLVSLPAKLDAAPQYRCEIRGCE